MSDRPLIKPNAQKPLISAGDMSANITSPVTIIQNLPGISYDLAWTGTPTGTFTVQVSNSCVLNSDGTLSSTNPGSWNDLPSSSFNGNYPAPSGSAGKGFLDVVGTEAYAVRLIYTAATGSGSLTVLPAAKVF